MFALAFFPILVLAFYVGVAVIVLVALWRAMRAHEAIAQHLGGIERALSHNHRAPPFAEHRQGVWAQGRAA